MSSSEQKQLRKALERAERAADRLGVDESTMRRGAATAFNIRQRFGVNLVTIAVAVLAVWGVTALLGVPVSLTGVAVLAGLGIVVSLATNRTGSFGFGFWIVTAGLVIAAVQVFVPADVAAQLSFLVAPLRNVPVVSRLFELGPLAVVALALGIVTLVWAFDIRVGTALYRKSGQPEAANPDTVARALATRFEMLFDDYVGVASAFAVLGLSMLAVAGAAALDVSGEAFAIIGQDPVGVAAAVNTFLGWLGLGGRIAFLEGVPVIGPGLDALGGIGPELYAVIGIVALGLAFAAREARD